MDNTKNRHSGVLLDIVGSILFYSRQGFVYDIN